MPPKRTNPSYYAGDLRADLVAEALLVIEADGPDGLSLRALSRRLGVSHAAPKNHFSTKDALFIEIAKAGFAQLHNILDNTLSSSKTETNPLEQLAGLGLAYLSFATDHPAHFALMFRGDLVDQAEIAEHAAAAFGVLHGAAKAAQDQGWRTDTDSRTMAVMLWSTVHGYAHLEKGQAPTTADQQQRVRVIRALLHAGPPEANLAELPTTKSPKKTR